MGPRPGQIYADYKHRANDGAATARFLQINDDIAIWAAPIELFCEIEMKISDQSPFPFTLHFGYSNGMLDYFPTKAEFAHGGYEVDVSPFTEQGEDDLIRAVLTHFQGASR